jgi:hypothetical protein
MSSAYYSARAGCAFVPATDNDWLRWNVDERGEWKTCSSWDVTLAFRGCTDVIELPAQDKQLIQDALVHADHVMNATDLTLWLLDPTLSERTRTSAACELNPFLKNAAIVEDWKGIFWWQPLGRDADLVNALRIAASVKAEPVAVQLQDLQQRQEAITHVHDQLEAVLASDAVEPADVAIVRQRVRTVRWHVAVVEVFGRQVFAGEDWFEREVCQLCPVPTNVKEAKWWRSWMKRLTELKVQSTRDASAKLLIAVIEECLRQSDKVWRDVACVVGRPNLLWETNLGQLAGELHNANPHVIVGHLEKLAESYRSNQDENSLAALMGLYVAIAPAWIEASLAKDLIANVRFASEPSLEISFPSMTLFELLIAAFDGCPSSFKYSENPQMLAGPEQQASQRDAKPQGSFPFHEQLEAIIREGCVPPIVDESTDESCRWMEQSKRIVARRPEFEFSRKVNGSWQTAVLLLKRFGVVTSRSSP